MLLFLKRYSIALVCLVGAMCAYRLLVVPIVEPTGRPPAEIPVYKSAVASNRWWDQFFADDSWQMDSPSLLQSGQGILLAKSWDQIGPKTLELRPLTIIIPQSRDEQSTPGGPNDTPAQRSVWVVSADEGATIHFEKDFDAKTEPIPSIASGKLTGAIHITTKTIGVEDADALTIEMRDLFFERDRVRTDSQVKIQWADNTIVGRQLRIELLGDLFSPDNETVGRWGPLDKMELLRIENVDLGLENGGIWAGLSENLLPENTNILNLAARLQVRCNGRFGFDFRHSTATLTDGVQVHQFLGDQFRDEFACQQLDVTFSEDAAPEAADNSNASFGDLQLERLSATGIDELKNFRGEKKVELKAPSIGAFAAAKRLSVDFRNKRVEFDGQLAMAGATQSIAWLRFGPYEFRAPQIEYDADGDGQNPDVQHLGYLAAGGPGELNISEDHEMGTTQIRWLDALQMWPTDDPNQQKLGIFGKTLVESRRYGFVTSDKIEIWLRKNDQPSTDVNATSLASASYQPESVLATGNVAIEAASIRAQVDKWHLGLIFQAPEPMPASAAEPTDSPALSNSEGYGMYQWVGPPPAGDQQTATVSEDTKSTTPVLIEGVQLSSRIVLAGKRSWVDDLQIQGPLKMSRAAQPDSKDPDWSVQGNHLGLVTSADGHVNMRIDGDSSAPARILVAGAELAGQSFSFDQELNLIWMDHPGEFSLPIPAKSQQPLPQPSRPGDNLAAAKEIQWLEPPRCSWQGGMLFDGNIIHLKGQVTFNGKMRGSDSTNWIVKSTSDELKIYLNARVDMQAKQQTPVDMKRIELVNNVNVSAVQIGHDGTRQNFEHINVPLLAFHNTENRIVAYGPGSVRSWIANKPKPVPPGRMVTATPPQAPFTGTHMVFRDSIVAFLEQNEVVVEGKVQALSGPVRSVEETIDIYQTQNLSHGQMLLSCDQMTSYDTSKLRSASRFASPTTGRGTWNFHARGNVTFEGLESSGHYEGEGKEIQFIQSKDLIRLKGDEKRDASITVTPPPNSGAKTIVLSIREAEVNAKTLNVDVIKLGAAGARASGIGMSAGNPAAGIPDTDRDARPQPRDAVNSFLQNGGR